MFSYGYMHIVIEKLHDTNRNIKQRVLYQTMGLTLD